MPNLIGNGRIDTIKSVHGRFSPEASRVQLSESDDEKEEEKNQISIDALKAKRLDAESYAIHRTAKVAAEIKRREAMKTSEHKHMISSEASKAQSIMSKYINT